MDTGFVVPIPTLEVVCIPEVEGANLPVVTVFQEVTPDPSTLNKSPSAPLVGGNWNVTFPL